MKEERILSAYPAGDAEAQMLVGAAKQIEAALVPVLEWSIALGGQLVMLLSSRRLEFSDGTVLGDPAIYQSYIGNREAALIAAALDPEDRGADFWHHVQVLDYSSPEMVEMEVRLPAALVAAGIRLD